MTIHAVRRVSRLTSGTGAVGTVHARRLLPGRQQPTPARSHPSTDKQTSSLFLIICPQPIVPTAATIPGSLRSFPSPPRTWAADLPARPSSFHPRPAVFADTSLEVGGAGTSRPIPGKGFAGTASPGPSAVAIAETTAPTCPGRQGGGAAP
jgi:hypothetical protein